jgi:predicted helicase
MQLSINPTNSNLIVPDAMSLKIIQQYYTEIFKLRNIGKQDSESVLRRAFARVLEGFAAKTHLTLFEEFTHKTNLNTSIRFDGVLKNELGLDFGYWEAKANVDLEDEIRKKFNKGYPKSNILFEDGIQAVLFQDGLRVLTVEMANDAALNDLLQQFFAFEPPALRDFREAVERFKNDVPDIVLALRAMIETQNIENQPFKNARNRFLQICREAINPEIQVTDVNEMLIQHILTEQIFIAVFNDDQLIRENNIARELYQVEATFFKGAVKRTVLDKIKNYYLVIAREAQNLQSHHEKQFFLKKVYELFYKAYNPKGADKLGIVYTPSEIVRFQIHATEYLLETHFGKTLSHKGVEILDPATGTGTYLCELIEHIAPHALEYKFKNELFANEIAILPYYIANLNIEYTFRQKMKVYESFPNLCFVDTLDNLAGLKLDIGKHGKTGDLFGISDENKEKIVRQNKQNIAVIIGNPPYNAKQANFNDENQNRTYAFVDKRIKETFIKHGKAQNQIVVYDMYVRFYRWAMDRLSADGIISFITNRSFIDGQAFDGFRKVIQSEFDYIYIVDTQSDVRKNPKISGTTHNVFGIQTGVALLFLVKKKKRENRCKLFYTSLADEMPKVDKLNWFREESFDTIDFERIIPDEKGNWINQTDNDFDELIPLMSKEEKKSDDAKAIFKTFSNGVKTQRDEWVYDFSKEHLQNKIKFFAKIYNKNLGTNLSDDKFLVKWDRELTGYAAKNLEKSFENEKIVVANYRPFFKQYFYYDKHFNGMTYQFPNIIPFGSQNKSLSLCISGIGFSKSFQALAINSVPSLDILEKTQCLPLYAYDKNGAKQENITDWALQQFTQQYNNQAITKEQIFYYVYAVLHAPAYRTAYEQNLKRDFPRIPFYADFNKYAVAGKQLADLHIGYETVALYPLQIIEKQAAKDFVPKAKLKADKTNHCIEIDDITKLYGVPETAWDYKLGNRSALEWVLDQYKESKPTDKTILEHFNTYRFADYKQKVIDLLMRVSRVSVETVALISGL